jgi:large subunit ribosomal protein L21
MYAVVKTGGKQLKVAVGETVSVELLDASAGSVVTLPVLLVSDGERIFVGDAVAKATVTAEVLGHGKADKVVIFKLKKRKGYKRTRGHRQPLTLLKVTDIALAGTKKAAKAAGEGVPVQKAAPKKTAPKKAATVTAEKTVATKKAAAPQAEAESKSAAKMPVAAKKPVAAKESAAAKTVVADKKPAAVKKPADKKPAAVKKPADKKPAAKKTPKPAEPA